MLKDSIATYGIISRILHWVMSIMIIGMLCGGFYMTSIADSDQKWQIYAFHKATGVVLLLLISIRLLWRFSNATPILPSTVGNLEKRGYNIGITSLYLLMILMPSTGLLMSLYSGYPVSVYGLFTLPAFTVNKALAMILDKVHIYSAILLSFLVIGHVIMALYHHFIVKDRVLLRMISGK